MAEITDKNAMPFVAPCRTLDTFAAFGWIKKGWGDFRTALPQSLTYGFLMTAVIAGVVGLSLTYGSQWIMFSMLGGFVFLAPLACIGLYAISAQLERGLAPSIRRSFRAAYKRHISNELVFAIVLLVLFLTWARAAVVITAVMMPEGAEPGLSDLIGFLSFGSAVGAMFAAITFSISAFSLPMIVHRDVDGVTAIITSVNAVLRNKSAMLMWLILIIVLLLLGIFTGFLGLVIILPLIGYGAWHAYLETINADDFPRHTQGITSTPRKLMET